MTATVDVVFGLSALTSRAPFRRDLSSDSSRPDTWIDSPESGRASEDTMIMEGIDTLSHVSLSADSQPFGLSLSFDTYKLPSETIDEKTIRDAEKGDEPATAGDNTPGSPGSAIIETHSVQVGDTLNTPASTAPETPSFFASPITTIPDAVPITGMLSEILLLVLSYIRNPFSLPFDIDIYKYTEAPFALCVCVDCSSKKSCVTH